MLGTQVPRVAVSTIASPRRPRPPAILPSAAAQLFGSHLLSLVEPAFSGRCDLFDE